MCVCVFVFVCLCVKMAFAGFLERVESFVRDKRGSAELCIGFIGDRRGISLVDRTWEIGASCSRWGLGLWTFKAMGFQGYDIRVRMASWAFRVKRLFEIRDAILEGGGGGGGARN